MKKKIVTFVSLVLIVGLASPAIALAAPAPHTMPIAPSPVPLQLGAGLTVTAPQITPIFTQDYSAYANLNAEELWTQFARAEANKKLYELKERAGHEQIRLYEGPGATFFYYNGGISSDAYNQLLQLKNQEYTLKMQKEQYEWEKKQVETYLRLTGAKMGKAEIQYALYAGTLAASGLSFEELYSQSYALKMQEQQLELQKKNLEYQYQIGQLSDTDFVNQFASIFRQKEAIKMQKDQMTTELEMMVGTYGPGVGPGPGIGITPLPMLP